MEKFKYLINQEFVIDQLSRELISLGCEDIWMFDNWDEIIDSGVVIVAIDECGDNHIRIEFDVTIPHNPDSERFEDSYVKIISIDEI